MRLIIRSFPLFLLETSKTEIAELENLGFMDNVPSSLSNLFLPASKEIQCVESIVFSSFNPPPSYRRFCIT